MGQQRAIAVVAGHKRTPVGQSTVAIVGQRVLMGQRAIAVVAEVTRAYSNGGSTHHRNRGSKGGSKDHRNRSRSQGHSNVGSKHHRSCGSKGGSAKGYGSRGSKARCDRGGSKCDGSSALHRVLQGSAVAVGFSACVKKGMHVALW